MKSFLYIIFSLILMSIFLGQGISFVKEKNEIINAVEDTIMLNFLTPQEESKALGLIKKFSNKFKISVDRKGEVCGPLNCYNINFYPLIESYILSTALFCSLCLIVLILLLKWENKLRSIWNSLVGENNALKEFEFNTRSFAHDLKTPIDVLKMVYELEQNMDSDLKELFQDSLLRLSNINDSLVKGNQSATKLDTNEKSWNISQRVNEILTGFQLQQNKVQFTIDNRVRDQLTSFSKSEFDRIFSNLLNNAVEAADRISPCMKIYFNQVNGFLELGIENNGNNFPSEIIKSGPKRYLSIGKKNGNGIGLSYALETLKKAGGNLLIANNETGKGAKVTLQIPFVVT